MQDGIHPKYMPTVVKCGCGESFVTRSTLPEIKVDICSVCHPLYTGKLKFVDTAGQHVTAPTRDIDWTRPWFRLNGARTPVPAFRPRPRSKPFLPGKVVPGSMELWPTSPLSWKQVSFDERVADRIVDGRALRNLGPVEQGATSCGNREF